MEHTLGDGHVVKSLGGGLHLQTGPFLTDQELSIFAPPQQQRQPGGPSLDLYQVPLTTNPDAPCRPQGARQSSPHWGTVMGV